MIYENLAVLVLNQFDETFNVRKAGVVNLDKYICNESVATGCQSVLYKLFEDQLMETESNMKMLTELLPEIDGYKSKLILYSYDSFLFDFHLKDGLKFLNKVKGIIEQSGKFP